MRIDPICDERRSRKPAADTLLHEVRTRQLTLIVWLARFEMHPCSGATNLLGWAEGA